MRLLTYYEDGKLSTKRFDADQVPPYAILSHTWGDEDEEVTFSNIINGDGLNKAEGFKKIHFCGTQARRDGLQYFWVDSCCIDTTDKAEHSHAIRSMFRWYQAAERCYVYLSDVPGSSWESAFRSSRWFTRGWTLQELLAPHIVEFFSQEGDKLGEKSSLRSMIHKITSIPPETLDGAPIFQFSFEERLRWKGDRETKREEDAWYSMSGIFGVELAPAYSEGAANAFRRLKDEFDKTANCIRDLHCTTPYDDKKRIEATKGGLLVDSYRWVLENNIFRQWQQNSASRLLWVKGDPGKGKTMLLCGIIDELQKSMPASALLSYFFCQGTDSRINSATAVLRGLLYMLVHQQPLLASHIRKKYDQTGKALFEDVNAWTALTEISAAVLQDPTLSNTCLVIDALDECVTDLPKLLDFIAEQSTVSSRVKWIVSSRNWQDIEAKLEQVGYKIKLSLELNAKSVATAVNIFIQQKVNQLAQEKQYQEELRLAVLERLTSNANDTFLWVALACQELAKTSRRHVLKKLTLFPPGLDALYEQMMHQMSRTDDAEICRQVLAAMAILYRPVAICELVPLIEALEEFVDDLESVREIIGSCRSFLTLRGDIVYFVHQSAQDFLLKQAYDTTFPRGDKYIHRAIFSKSLAIMSRSLHRDMYNLTLSDGIAALGLPVQSIKPPNPDPMMALRYPCVYWIDHLCKSEPEFVLENGNNYQVKEELIKFLKEKYLYWLEGLSLCKNVEKGVVSITKFWTFVQELHDEGELVQLVQDARRFIMYHKGAIKAYPLQIYASALFFSPTGSLIRNLFYHKEPKEIIIMPALSQSWSACLQTLEEHSDWVRSVAFSHDSARLASASDDRTVKIWDAHSGACLQTLEGHSNWVQSVAFSHDSARLASASSDRTIKIWDARSGACLQTLKGHSSSVTSVAFSPDSARLASASWDSTVKIWDTHSGACLQTLEGHGDWVHSVAFSHGSARLASASYNRMVKIWDARSGACLLTLEGHGEWVNSVAFSHDSTTLASASFDRTVKIWDAYSGACLQTLKGHSDWVRSVAFSHDSARLVSASSDGTVKIWDTYSGACLQTLEGHSNIVRSVAYSPDSTRLASASDDKTVKIWDAHSRASLQMLEGHSSSIRSVAFSHDSARLASASDDRTVKIWDAHSGACLQTLKGHGDWVRSVTFSHDSARLASVSDDRTIKIWDAYNGACLQTLEGHSSFDIPSILATQPCNEYVGQNQQSLCHDLNISVDNMWVSINSRNLLWLPSEHRPICSTASYKSIAVGTGHGKIWIARIK